jgi:2-keto-4-pentenoate hydratase/2-oxohepta-3-ene-1,7-dioic acid hydratase in catechol pathway
MKLVLFDNYRPGILKDGTVIDAGPVAAGAGIDLSHWQTLLPRMIERFDQVRGPLEQLAATGTGRPLAQVRLRAPNPAPPKLLACFGNYLDSPRERIGRSPQDMFLKNPDGIIGDGDTVVLPPHKATVFHHEAELAIVIGRRTKAASVADAPGAVFGYTCFVDVSGRGLVTVGQNSRMGKSFDTFGPMGPCIVTADEVPDPNHLQVRLWVDGELRQDYNTDTMEYLVPEVVAFASQCTTLLPGDVISCGTHHLGLGPLQDGERAEMEIERIGRFSFLVSDPSKRSWPKGIDRTPTNPIVRGVV